MSEAKIDIRHPRLRRLHDYWLAKRGQRTMPSRADIAVPDIAYVLGDVMLVDVIGAPPRFRIRLHGSNLSLRAGYELTGRMLDELPETEFRRQVRDRWMTVATSGRPLCCDRDGTFDGRHYWYESLILPLSTDGERVNMELVAVIYGDSHH
jgi:hypothetical protein